MEYLAKFATSKKVVREEDIKEFFDGMKKNKKMKSGGPPSSCKQLFENCDVKFANFSAPVKVLSNVALGNNGGSFGIPQYTFFYFFIWKKSDGSGSKYYLVNS